MVHLYRERRLGIRVNKAMNLVADLVLRQLDTISALPLTSSVSFHNFHSGGFVPRNLKGFILCHLLLYLLILTLAISAKLCTV